MASSIVSTPFAAKCHVVCLAHATADTFWPLSSVEGGAGANSICAPQNGGCSTSLPAGIVGVNSEQNFQSNAHSSLRNRVGPTANAAGVFRYHFRTAWYDGTVEAATEVVWYLPNSEFVDTYQKRSGEEPLSVYRVVDRFYANGTASQTKQLITRRQVRAHRHALVVGCMGFRMLTMPMA